MKKALGIVMFFCLTNFSIYAQQEPTMFLIPPIYGVKGANNAAFFAGVTDCYLVTNVQAITGNTQLELTDNSLVFKITNGVCPTNCDITSMTASEVKDMNAATQDIMKELATLDYNAFLLPSAYFAIANAYKESAIIAMCYIYPKGAYVTYSCISGHNVIPGTVYIDFNANANGYHTQLYPPNYRFRR